MIHRLLTIRRAAPIQKSLLFCESAPPLLIEIIRESEDSNAHGTTSLAHLKDLTQSSY